MTKKIGLIAIVILMVIAAFAMNMRRSRMMGGAGSQIELMAVSADGSQISPAADVISITGELPTDAGPSEITLSPFENSNFESVPTKCGPE